MKKCLMALSIVLGVFSMSNGQLTNAIISQETGDIKIAKESIDKYMAKEKSQTDAKGWFYKGLIYETIAFSKDPAISALEPKDALKICIEAYFKTNALDKPKGDWTTTATKNLENVWGNAYNAGIEKMNAELYKESLVNLTLCQQVKPTDTLAYTVGAYIAIKAKDFEYAKNAYKKLLDLNYKTINNYKNLYYVVKEELKDTTEAIKIISDARRDFPTNKDFIAQEIDLLISTKRQQEAITKLSAAAVSDPTNASLYLYNLGIIYKQLKDNVKAKDYFNQSLAKNPMNDGSNFMIGFMLMEEGDIINKKVNNMTMKDYTANGKKMETQRDDLYKKAIPFLEKSYTVSKESDLKGQLITLYKKFKMEDKIKGL